MLVNRMVIHIPFLRKFSRIAVTIICLQLTMFVGGAAQERPRPDVRRKNAEGRAPKEKADKWSRGQRTSTFKQAVERRPAETKPRDREVSAGGRGKRVEKSSKWTREFKRAVDGKTVEKKQPERRNRTGDVARRADKESKWAGTKGSKLGQGQHTKRFNEAANPKGPNNGGKSGSGGAAPPPGPAPRPRP